MPVSTDRSPTRTDLARGARDRIYQSRRLIVAEELSGSVGICRVRTPECDNVAVRTEGRLPERSRYAGVGRRDRREDMALLIIDDDVAAVLNQYLAAIAADGGRGTRRDLCGLLVMCRVGRVIVVGENDPARPLVNNEAAVRIYGRRVDRDPAAGARDRDRDARLPVEQENRPVGVVGDELP